MIRQQHSESQTADVETGGDSVRIVLFTNVIYLVQPTVAKAPFWMHLWEGALLPSHLMDRWCSGRRSSFFTCLLAFLLHWTWTSLRACKNTALEEERIFHFLCMLHLHMLRSCYVYRPYTEGYEHTKGPCYAVNAVEQIGVRPLRVF